MPPWNSLLILKTALGARTIALGAERTVPAFVATYIPFNYVTILSLLAIAGGIYFFVVGLRLLSRERVLLATPSSRIRSAALGLVEINGKAAGPNTMTAPISGKPCFLYRTTAWQRPDGKKDWSKAAGETFHIPFFLDDSTGKMLVEPMGADLDLDSDLCEEYVTSRFSSSDDIPQRVRSFLARHNVGSNRPLRIEECLIKPDQPLFIAGTVMENPGVEVRSREPNPPSPPQGEAGGFAASQKAPEVVKLYGGAVASKATDMTQQGKIAAALVRAGITKPEAWSAAGVSYPPVAVENDPLAQTSTRRSGAGASDSHKTDNRKLMAESSGRDVIESSSFDLNPPTVLMKGEHDSTFVISFRSQKELLGSLGWKSAGMIWGGSAISMLGFYMLMLQSGIVL